MSGTSQITFDLKNTSEFAGWLEGKSSGTYNIGIKATADPDVYEDSDVASLGTFLIASITPTLNNCTAKTDNPTTIPQGFEKQLIFYADDGYTFSDDKTEAITIHAGVTASDITWVVVDIWPTPEATISETLLTMPKIAGVTKYKVYANGTYLGYISDTNEWNPAT